MLHGRRAVMPLKTCHCGRVYHARWRNTPPLCPACVLAAVVCPACWRVTRVSDDPHQLSLFSDAVMARRGAYVDVAELLRDHFANALPLDLERISVPEWPERPSNAERTRYPYH